MGSMRNYEEKGAETLRESIQIPGFRKGKVPIGKILESYPLQVKERAVELIAKEGLNKFLDEKKWEASERATITDIKYENDNMILKLSFHVYEDVELKKYKGFDLKRSKVEVTKKEIDEFITNIASQNSVAKIKKEGLIAANDLIFGDIAVESGDFKKKLTNQKIDMSKDDFGFEKEVVGLEVSDKLSLEIDTPKQGIFSDEKSMDSKLKVDIGVESVKSVSPMKVDDDLGKAMGLKDLEGLKEKVASELKLKKDSEEDVKLFGSIMEKIKKENEVKIPGNLIDEEFERRKKGMESHLKEGDIVPKEGIDKFNEKLLKEVKDELKEIFIIRKIIEEEKIGVTPEEIKEKGKQIFGESNNMAKEAEAYLSRSILMGKVKKIVIEANISK